MVSQRQNTCLKLGRCSCHYSRYQLVTVVTQTFVNPLSTEAISEVFYSFPLYESSSIIGFTCRVGDTVIEGIVKPKEKANKIYQKAESKGKTAAILESSLSAADVFSTRQGNFPAGGTVLITITLIYISRHYRTSIWHWELVSRIRPGVL
jgi:hypothetical protein